MKDVYSDAAASNNVVKHWHCQVKRGRTSVKTAPIPGRSHSVVDVDRIHKVGAAILEVRLITIRQLTQDVMITVGSEETKLFTVICTCGSCLYARLTRILTPFQKQE